jgi:hypothetical protein
MASRHRWQALEWSCASWGEGERLGRARAVPLDRVAANVAVAQDRAGNLKPAKDKSTERIDRIVAAIMAIGCPWSPRTNRKSSTACCLCE